MPTAKFAQGVYTSPMSSNENILASDHQIRDLLSGIRTIAVLGIKPETHAGQPAHYVARYMADAGYDVIPVPVYYPEVTEILGKPVYRCLLYTSPSPRD